MSQHASGANTPDPGQQGGGVAVFDEAHVRSIFGDDTLAVIDLVDLVIADLPQHQAALSAHLHAERWDDLARSAHTVKGAAGNVGALAVTASARSLEDAARRQDYGAVPGLVATLSSSIDTLLHALAGWKHELQRHARGAA